MLLAIVKITYSESWSDIIWSVMVITQNNFSIPRIFPPMFYRKEKSVLILS